MAFELALIEKYGEDGISAAEATSLMGLLGGAHAYPIEFSAHQVESTAMGFVAVSLAQALEFEYDELGEFVASIMDDMELESADGTYAITTPDGVERRIYLGR